MAFSLNGLYNMTYGSSITECPHWLLLQMCVCGFLLATVVLFQTSCQMNSQCMHLPYLYKSTAFVRPNLYGLVAVHVRSGRTRKEKSTVTAVLKMAQSVEV